MTPDFWNGQFELLASILVLRHCRVLRVYNQSYGAGFWSTVFFVIWGIWNLYYYPSLFQKWSTAGAVCVTIANSYWVFLIIKYRYWIRIKSFWRAYKVLRG
jgi:hypothetical protein